MTGGFLTHQGDQWVILKYSRKVFLASEIPSFLVLVQCWSHCGWLKLRFLFIHLLSPCLRRLNGEAVSLVLSRKEILPVFDSLHTGCSDLGKTCYYTVILQLRPYVHLLCSNEWTPLCCFWASSHFKFVPKIFIEKVVGCFHTEIKPIHFYEGNVPG